MQFKVGTEYPLMPRSGRDRPPPGLSSLDEWPTERRPLSVSRVSADPDGEQLSG